MCEAWDADIIPKKVPNPYHTEGLGEYQDFASSNHLLIYVTALSEAEVRKELAKEEEGRLGNGGIALHEVSASAFIALGLELEDAQ